MARPETKSETASASSAASSAATAAASAPRAPGRPREPGTDAAILEATRTLLMSRGYARLSIPAIAEAAGVTRPTVYRRWPTKARLVHEAVFPGGDTPPAPDTGTFGGDLRVMVTRVLRVYSRPEARAAIPGLLADYRDDPELHEQLSARLGDTARAQFRTLTSRAALRGEVRADLNTDLLFDMLLGTLMQMAVINRRSQTPAAIDELTDMLTRSARPDR